MFTGYLNIMTSAIHSDYGKAAIQERRWMVVMRTVMIINRKRKVRDDDDNKDSDAWVTSG